MNILAQQIFLNKEIASLPAMAEEGGLPALVSGLSAVHRANFAAALRIKTGRPLVVICPDDSGCESMARDLRAMTGEEIFVLLGRELTFYPTVAASRQAEQRRIGTLYAMARGEAAVCVASAAGLMQRTLPPETLLKAGGELFAGGECAPEDAMDMLIRCGYERCEQVEGTGQFSARGGILDFFSPAYEEPVRIEFWGDEIDSMGLFDVATQRRTRQLDSCRILPAAETLPSLAEGGAAALSKIISEYADKCEKRKSEAAAALAGALRADAQALSGGLSLSHADRYLPVCYPFAAAIDYFPADCVAVIDQPGRVKERAAEFSKRTGEDIRELNRRGVAAASAESFFESFEAACTRLCDFPLFMVDDFTVGRYPVAPRTTASIQAKQLPSYGGSLQTAEEDVRIYLKQDYRVAVLAGDRRRAELLTEHFRKCGIEAVFSERLEKMPESGCVISVGAISAGIEYPQLRLAILTDAQLMRVGTRRAAKSGKKLPSDRQRLLSYSDLAPGDVVVHEHHGIGRFAGIVKLTVDGFEKDYMKISYAGTDSLYVPCTQLDLVTKYIGAGGEDKPVRLSKMGGAEWHRTRTRAKAAAKDMAKGLLKLYAQRQRTPGHAFAPDAPWQTQFEENFGYAETDDQIRCINEIKADMEKTAPMDRLLCGDVGYGKTEVALRAVMKCILDGKQAAFLCPTTVLAQQHLQTAVQRFYGFPADIEILSRFQTGAELKRTLLNIKSGKCDLVIGTHRLLQKDVEFKALGLLVVDEEQRFGVTHKEHIKTLSKGVDVLTLSATPIPRTLNMALSGIRDMSTIEEPPQDRRPVQTFVMEHDRGIIADAIRRELARGGQVYYLHNHIDSMEKTVRMLREDLDTSVAIGIAHGQMDKRQLANAMDDMAEGKIQILVCTTIIETGIDIPNVNTLIIEDADRMGLAQLHQIRGRVGRSTRKASAYLTFRRDKVLTEIQEKRLSAIREFAQFGSGFKIAMRDLEIRGAGSLLGAEQSGFMTDVGYDMYLKLLEQAVQEEKGERPEIRTSCSADLAVAANIPDRYVPSQEQRMDLYRRIALIRTQDEADDLTDELIDRFGDPPSSVNSLIHVALMRGEASRAGITDVTQKAGDLRFTVAEFDMERVSELYAKPEYTGRLRVQAGSKPALALKLAPKARVIDVARRFIADWESAGKSKETVNNGENA